MHKVRLLMVMWGVGMGLLVGEYFFYDHFYSMSDAKRAQKECFSALVGLPDSALVSEAHYVRHRSLSTPFAFFSESPSLMEYFPSTFVYHYTPSQTHIPSRIERGN